MPDDPILLQHGSLTSSEAGESIVGWVRAGVVDADLAGLVWLLLDGSVPVLVAGSDGVERRAAQAGVIGGMLSAMQTVVRVEQAADVGVLADAAELGWLTEPERVAGASAAAAPPGSTTGPDAIRAPAVLVADELGPALGRRWRAAVRVLVRAPSRGFGLVSSIGADSLEGVYASLRSLQTALTDDEISYLGVIIVVEAAGGADGPDGARVHADEAPAPPPVTGAGSPADIAPVAVVHYLRPVARDAHGHVQRLGPAVLASRDEERGTFEHFAWGIYPELAARIGMRAGDLEAEHARRSAYLAGLARSGVVDRVAVTAALDGYRREAALPHSH
jgi:acylphosphatase